MSKAKIEKLRSGTVFDTETKERGVRNSSGWRRADSEGKPKGHYDMSLNGDHGDVDVIQRAKEPKGKQKFVSNVLKLRPGTLFSFNLGDRPDGIVVRGGLWKRINKWPLIEPESYRHNPGTVWAWGQETLDGVVKPAEGKKVVEKLKKQLIPIAFLPVGSVFDYNGHRYVVTVGQKQFVDAQKDGRIRHGGTAYNMTSNVMVEWVMSTEGLDGKKYQEPGQQALVFAKREIQGVTDSMARVEESIKTLKGDVRAIARDMMAKGKGKGPEREQRLDRREKKPRGRKPKAQPEEYRHEDDDIPF